MKNLEPWEYLFIAKSGKSSPNNSDLNEKMFIY